MHLKKFRKLRNFSTTVDYVTMRFIPGVFLACTILMTFNQFTKTSIVCYTSTIPMSGHGIASFLENSCYLMKRYMDGGLNLLKHNNLYMWFPIILILQTSVCVYQRYYGYSLVTILIAAISYSWQMK